MPVWVVVSQLIVEQEVARPQRPYRAPEHFYQRGTQSVGKHDSTAPVVCCTQFSMWSLSYRLKAPVAFQPCSEVSQACHSPRFAMMKRILAMHTADERLRTLGSKSLFSRVIRNAAWEVGLLYLTQRVDTDRGW